MSNDVICRVMYCIKYGTASLVQTRGGKGPPKVGVASEAVEKKNRRAWCQKQARWVGVHQFDEHLVPMEFEHRPGCDSGAFATPGLNHI